jgi:hypothetical protein
MRNTSAEYSTLTVTCLLLNTIKEGSLENYSHGGCNACSDGRGAVTTTMPAQSLLSVLERQSQFSPDELKSIDDAFIALEEIVIY